MPSSWAGPWRGMHGAGAGRGGAHGDPIDPRTYLGGDVTATMRPWLPAAKGRCRRCWQRAWRRGRRLCPAQMAPADRAAHGRAEDRAGGPVAGRGVKILYSSLPVGILAGEDGCQGHHRQQVGAASAGLHAGGRRQRDGCAGAWQAGSSPAPKAPGRETVWRTLEFTGVRAGARPAVLAGRAGGGAGDGTLAATGRGPRAGRVRLAAARRRRDVFSSTRGLAAHHVRSRRLSAGGTCGLRQGVSGGVVVRGARAAYGGWSGRRRGRRGWR